MANCKNCGRELPSFSIGEIQNHCPDCQHTLAQTGVASSTQDVPRVRIVKRRPPITTALIVINIAVYLLMVFRGVSPTTPTSVQVLPWGANWGPLSLGPQPWRILVSNYLHFGIVHIALNMWCLWNLGGLGEQLFDPITFFLTYTCCGIAGSLASLWWHPMVVGAGASGAIFGIAGALIAALYLGHLPVPKEALRGTLKSLVTFAGYNLFFGAAIGVIDNSAHIGGLLTGLVMGALLGKHLALSPKPSTAWRRGVPLATALVLCAAFFSVRQVRGYVVPLDQGVNALRSGDFDKAAAALEEANTRKPGDHDLMVLLATAYLQQKEYTRAEPLLQKAMQVDANDQNAMFNLGLVELKLGRYDEAIEYLNKLLRLNPNDADAQQALGEAYSAKNMQREAQAALQRAADIRAQSKKQ